MAAMGGQVLRLLHVLYAATRTAQPLGGRWGRGAHEDRELGPGCAGAGGALLHRGGGGVGTGHRRAGAVA